MVLLKNSVPAIILLCLLVLIAGCRSGMPSYHIREDMDMSFIKKVAVLPLANLTGDQFSDETVRHIVISELLASGMLDVVIPGESNKAIAMLRTNSISSPDIEQIKELGRVLKVEAVITGAVEQYGFTRHGAIAVPEVTITLMMADTATGSIIWSVTRTRGKASFAVRHFGARSKTMSETVLEVVRDALHTLTNHSY